MAARCSSAFITSAFQHHRCTSVWLPEKHRAHDTASCVLPELSVLLDGFPLWPLLPRLSQALVSTWSSTRFCALCWSGRVDECYRSCLCPCAKPFTGSGVRPL
ncbi:hypothetical protein WMY93_016864 [Mugilogobius chulae]|uniref:Secreted protein n=1 Tax=Mugilogobius chulae TaxID=88201 RepID=A0AAW0NWT8_9GOBI